jgi:hypothetical protein
LFSVFLFMTFYLQQTLRFSPVLTGAGFLPLTGAVIIVAPLVQTRILPRLGARTVIATGMILGIIAMIVFTRLTPGGSYASEVLPGLVVVGAGAACIVSTAFATGTLGVQGEDAGVASAMVNTSQQVGGSIGISLLSTIFAGALSGYLASHHGTSASSAVAAVHAYSVGFTTAAVIFGVGLLVALVVLPSRRAVQARSRVAATSANQSAALAHLDLTQTGSPDRSDAA